jgi:hypothetical protein
MFFKWIMWRLQEIKWPYWWNRIVPESPRWLLSRGRIDDAEDVIRKTARINNVELPEKLFDGDVTKKTKSSGVWRLFTSRVLFVRTIIIFFNWFVLINLVTRYLRMKLCKANMNCNSYPNSAGSNVSFTRKIWWALFCFELKFYVAIWCEANCFALAPCERKVNLICIKSRRMRNGKFTGLSHASYPWSSIHSNRYFWVKN